MDCGACTECSAKRLSAAALAVVGRVFDADPQIAALLAAAQEPADLPRNPDDSKHEDATTDAFRLDTTNAGASTAAHPDDLFPQPFEAFLQSGRVPELMPCPDEPPVDWQPIFVVGCGRSGTTLVADMITAACSGVVFNEPRAIWISAMPCTDVWSVQSRKRHGTLSIVPADVSAEAAALMRKALYGYWKAHATNDASPCIIKQPEDAFRLEVLWHLFPDARVVHVVRDAPNVMQSISSFSNKQWYGPTDAKWAALCKETAALFPEHSCDELAFTTCLARRAEVEWACAVTAARTAALRLGKTEPQYIELKYEALIGAPADTFLKLLQVLRLTAFSDDAAPTAAQFVKPARRLRRPKTWTPQYLPAVLLRKELFDVVGA